MARPIPAIPGPGQESVWEYPRPPRLESITRSIQIYFNDVLVVDATSAWRVLETSHAPVYYLNPADIRMAYLRRGSGHSWCEWKGQAAYFDVVVAGRTAEQAAWTYEKPTRPFAPIANHIAFYAWAMDQCVVDGELVTPQPGRFYGGWITSDIVGPFKGEPGTQGW